MWENLITVLFLWEDVVTDISPYQLFSDTSIHVELLHGSY